MLRELFEYYLTPASVEAKESGYLYEAIAFESRARRNKHHWKPHWEFCQQQVQYFIEKHPEAKSIAIFGSGCLFEIPKNFLTKKMEKIILIDQVFPRSVRTWAKKFKGQVEIQERDLNRNFPEALQCDLILSANLLSQLTLVQKTPLEKATIEQKHFANLVDLRKPVLLWTDVERIYSDAKSGDNLEQEKTVFGPLPPAANEWIWNIAPAPEFDSKINVTLRMKNFVW